MSDTPAPTKLDILAELHADAVALLAKLHAAGETVEGDAALVLSNAGAAIADGINQLGTIVGGQALTDLQKLEHAVAAELQTQLPVIVEAVVTAIVAAAKSAATAAVVVPK